MRTQGVDQKKKLLVNQKPADYRQGSMQGLFTDAALAGDGEDGCGEALGLPYHGSACMLPTPKNSSLRRTQSPHQRRKNPDTKVGLPRSNKTNFQKLKKITPN